MKKRALLSLGLVASLTLAACGDGSGDSNGGDNGGAPSGDEVEVQPELNIAFNAQPPTLDSVTTTAHASRILARIMYEPLIDIDADGEVQPVLAESFEVSDDGLTLTFVLRDGLTFHDGSDVEVEDVLASLERWLELSTVGSTYFSEAEVDSPEDGVVTMTLPEPMFVAPLLLADPGQPAHVMQAEVIEAAGPEGVQEHIGTGPYTYGTWETDQYVRFDRFEDYTSPEGEPSGMAGEKTAYYDEMYVHFVGDDYTRMTGLQTGEYDMATPIPWDNVTEFENDDNIDLIGGESGLPFALLNKANSPLADENVRRAVIAALDTEEILLSSYGSDEYFTQNTAMMDEDSMWYVPVDDDTHQDYQVQDLDAAADYLDEAGYDGELIEIASSPEHADRYDTAVMLQQQLQEAGMNVELVTADWSTVLDMMSDPDGFDIGITGLNNWPVVPVTMYFLNPDTQGSTDSEEIFAANEAITSAEDEETAIAAMEDLQEAYLEYLPIIKFGDRRTANGLNAELTGYEYITGAGEVFHHIRPAE